MFTCKLLRGLPLPVCDLLRDPLSVRWKQVRQHCPKDYSLLRTCRKAFTTLRRKEEDCLRKTTFDNTSQKQREATRRHAIFTASQEQPFLSPSSRKRRYSDPETQRVRQLASPQSEKAAITVFAPQERSPYVSPPQDQEYFDADVMMEGIDLDIVMDLGLDTICPLIEMVDASEHQPPLVDTSCYTFSDPTNMFCRKLHDREDTETSDNINMVSPPLPPLLPYDDSPISSTGPVTPPSLLYEEVCATETLVSTCERTSYIPGDPDDLVDVTAYPTPDISSPTQTSAGTRDLTNTVPPPADSSVAQRHHLPPIDGAPEVEHGLDADARLSLLRFQEQQASKYRSRHARSIAEELQAASRSLGTGGGHPAEDAQPICERETQSGAGNADSRALPVKEDVEELLDAVATLALSKTTVAHRGPASEQIIWGTADAPTAPGGPTEVAEGVEESQTDADKGKLLDLLTFDADGPLPDYEDGLDDLWSHNACEPTDTSERCATTSDTTSEEVSAPPTTLARAAGITAAAVLATVPLPAVDQYPEDDIPATPDEVPISSVARAVPLHELLEKINIH